jgi:hypothetical protein
MSSEYLNVNGVVTGRFKFTGAAGRANLDRALPQEAEVVQTPQEIRAEVARERREAKKERQLDRKVKRQNKRSQAY